VPRTRSFAVSTHLYHGQRLNRDHLREIGSAGFDTVESFATRTHFDYHSDVISRPARLAGRCGWSWRRSTRQSRRARWGTGCAAEPGQRGCGSASGRSRKRCALQLGRRIPFRALVVHAGVLRAQQAPGENSRDAARRSIEALARSRNRWE
jgi:hypothetical protein